MCLGHDSPDRHSSFLYCEESNHTGGQAGRCGHAGGLYVVDFKYFISQQIFLVKYE